MLNTTAMPDNESATAFINRWRKSGGAERANYQMFVTELCALLGVEPPHPAVDIDILGETDKEVGHVR
jgi:hypothetical protein